MCYFTNGNVTFKESKMERALNRGVWLTATKTKLSVWTRPLLKFEQEACIAIYLSKKLTKKATDSGLRPGFASPIWIQSQLI